jgi:cell division protein FtsB
MFNILMDNYKKSKQINQIAEYNEELKEKNAKLEARIAELEAKEVPKEKKKFIGGE